MLDFDKNYISLEKVAGQLSLPQKFIREKAKAGKIPHLIVGSRLRFQLKAVRAALDKIGNQSIKPSRMKTILGGTKK